MNFLHVGKPTKEKIKGLDYNYVKAIKLFVTNPDKNEFKLQYVCAEEDSPLPEIVREENRISLGVSDIENDIQKFDQVVFGPVTISETTKIGFATKGGVLYELMDIKG